MNEDVTFGNTEDLRNEGAAACGLLRIRPDLQLSVLEAGAAVARLQRRVGNKGIRIGSLNRPGSGLECIVYIAIVLQGSLRRLLRQFAGSLRKTLTALLGGLTHFPFHVELLSCRLRGPPRLRQDSDAWFKTRVTFHDGTNFHRAFEDKRISNAGHLFYFVNVGTYDLASEDGTFLVYGIEHAGHGEIDAKDRLT